MFLFIFDGGYWKLTNDVPLVTLIQVKYLHLSIQMNLNNMTICFPQKLHADSPFLKVLCHWAYLIWLKISY